MPPGRTWQEKGPCQQRHGPYTHIQPAPKKVKPQQERQRFKVQALNQLDTIANEGLRVVEAELTTMAWARNQQIRLRLDQPHSTRMHCEIVDSEIFAPECRGYRFCHYRPCPGFLLFLSFRFLRCRLVSLTSVPKDSVSAADSSFNKSPWCVCPVRMSSLSELLEVYGPMPRGAGSPGCFPCQLITIHGYHTQGCPECLGVL